MIITYKPGELITLTKNGVQALHKGIANSLKRYPKAGEPLLYLKFEPDRMFCFRIAQVMEDGKQGGFRGLLNVATPNVEFKLGVKLFFLYRDSVIKLRFTTINIKKYLQKL